MVVHLTLNQAQTGFDPQAAHEGEDVRSHKTPIRKVQLVSRSLLNRGDLQGVGSSLFNAPLVQRNGFLPVTEETGVQLSHGALRGKSRFESGLRTEIE